MTIDLRLGDCRELLATLPDASIDAIIADPPYPEISRPYGRLTEAEWWDLMMVVCREARRVLKPSGSAVFVLQPNSRKVGSMRGWLWRFMAWACDEWNQIQDAWTWNTAAIPEAHAIQGRLMRPSIKACVWLGPPDCYRDQDSVLWAEAEHSRIVTQCARAKNEGRTEQPSGHGVDRVRSGSSADRRGGVTPFNIFPTTHGCGKSDRVAGAHGHGAGTPMLLCDYWVRYISPPEGVVCDPFCGSGTVGLAALRRGRSFVGFEQMPEYFAIAERRLAAESARHPLLAEV